MRGRPSPRPVRALVLLALVVAPLAAHAQTVVRGRVTDGRTGDGLPAATVQAVGTTRGTITNPEGDYELTVPASADSLAVRFLGYETAVRAVPSGGRLDVTLAPAVAALAEAVVTAPLTADELMRRVAARKRRWQAGLGSWRADVYSRQTIRARGAVVAVVEGQTTAFWDRDRGLREVVVARGGTANVGGLPTEAFSAAEQTLNLLDDEVEFGGYRLMGPTSPDAVGFYRFTVEGRRPAEGGVLYDLSFRPRNPLQPGFEGALTVLTPADAVVALDVRPSGAVQFPLVTGFDLTVRQQFSTFGQAADGEPVWLPVDYRMDGRGRAGNALLRFPDLGFSIASRFTDYQANVAVPDSLYQREGVAVDSAAVAARVPEAGLVPLSEDEARAVAEIDSTQSVLQALRPTGLLARFVNIEANGQSLDGDDPASDGAAGGERRQRAVDVDSEPDTWYNRVEEVHLGSLTTVRVGRLRTTLRLGYATEGAVTAGASVSTSAGRGVGLGASAQRRVVPIGESFYVGRTLNSVAALAVGEDYFDYVGTTGGEVWAQARAGGDDDGTPRSVRLGVAVDVFTTEPVRTTFALAGSLPAANAVLPSGGVDLARAGVSLRLGPSPGPVLASVAGHRSAELRLEAGRQRPDGLGATAYARAEADVRYSTPTVLRRRLLPPALHVRAAAGVASGLPLVRAFGVDGRLGGLAPFGALRARIGRLTLADRYALVAWEHDFRSVPFEVLGWRGAAPRGFSVQVHGAHAWGRGAEGATRVGGPFEHHEVGLSLGLGYSVPVRLDVTYRLTDGPGLVVGFGVARLF